MDDKKTALRVGAFFLVALMVFTVLVFTLGSRSNLFETKVAYRTTFKTVGGLRTGSPVQMAGVNVGTVSEVRLSHDGMVHVAFKVVRKEAGHIRADSVAMLANKGLLGDRVLEVTPGTGERVAPGDFIRSESGADLGSLASKAGGVINEAEVLTRNLRKLSDAFVEQGATEDIRAGIRSMRRFLDMLSDENSTVRALVTDPKVKSQVIDTVARVHDASVRASETLAQAQEMMLTMRQGPGGAHELLFSETGAKLVRSVAQLSEELTAAARELRAADSKDKAGIITNLQVTSANLRRISAAIADGKGTLGALVVDPSVYEDLKRLLGDVQQNDVLRSLVRYSIQKQEQK